MKNNETIEQFVAILNTEMYREKLAEMVYEKYPDDFNKAFDEHLLEAQLVTLFLSDVLRDGIIENSSAIRKLWLDKYGGDRLIRNTFEWLFDFSSDKMLKDITFLE